MRTTQQLSITLPIDMADVVKAKVKTGEYASESEVIRDGLRALIARDRAVGGWLEHQVGAAYDALKADPFQRPDCEQSKSPSCCRACQDEMTHRVIFSPEAEEQLVSLYKFIAAAASPTIAAGYTEAIVNYCESLAMFPMRGTVRSDVRPGLRVTHYKKRAVIAFSVDQEHVSILGVFYGGQDYESVLHEDPEDGPTH